MKLFLKTALFTLVMPGTFAGVVPLYLAGDQTAGGGIRRGLAMTLFAIGIVLYLRSAWDFAAFGRGTPAPLDAPKRLVVRGFYRYTRNPMYVAVLTVIAGWAALFQAPILVAYALIIFSFFYSFVRFYEEPRLAREFGKEYAEYTNRVDRWLPRIGRSDSNRGAGK